MKTDNLECFNLLGQFCTHFTAHSGNLCSLVLIMPYVLHLEIAVVLIDMPSRNSGHISLQLFLASQVLNRYKYLMKMEKLTLVWGAPLSVGKIHPATTKALWASILRNFRGNTMLAYTLQCTCNKFHLSASAHRVPDSL